MKRETPEQLKFRMQMVEHMVPAGSLIRHVRTGGEYIVAGHCLRVGDLGLMVNYRPRTGPVITFSREATAVQSKFVLMSGDEWRGPASFHKTEESGW